MNATLLQKCIPPFIHCDGSNNFNADPWPDDKYRALVAIHVLAYRDELLLEVERDTCRKQVSCLEMTLSDVARMDRLVHTYGWEVV